VSLILEKAKNFITFYFFIIDEHHTMDQFGISFPFELKSDSIETRLSSFSDVAI
jgi:hypothetical protein